MPQPILQLVSVSKHYGPVNALEEVSLSCRPGEVHAVLGENGAGKSTLMKLLCGVEQATSGSIQLAGKTVSFANPVEAAEAGVICIFQELSLLPNLSILENLVLGCQELSRAHLARKAPPLLARLLGRAPSLATPVSELRFAERQVVEIVRAILRKPRILIMDEATSSLPADVAETLYALVRDLRDDGLLILFISHRFYEVDALADRISVFRNGQHVATHPAGELSHDDVVGLMIGRKIDQLFPDRPVNRRLGETVVRVDKLCWSNTLSDVSFNVREGEIYGLAGLEGQGQQRVLQALFGVLRSAEGTIEISGQSTRGKLPGALKRSSIGLAFVPEDRKTEGLAIDMSVAANLEMAAAGLVPDMREKLSQLVSRLSLRAPDMSAPVSTLSGGNQQKVLLAKWLAISPRCLMLMDPTRGIDIKTKGEIYLLLHDLANEGVAIILQSSDYEELIHLCDRVGVFYRGRMTQEMKASELTAEALVAATINLKPKEAVQA